jgi:hypothetical protein
LLAVQSRPRHLSTRLEALDLAVANRRYRDIFGRVLTTPVARGPDGSKATSPISRSTAADYDVTGVDVDLLMLHVQV